MNYKTVQSFGYEELIVEKYKQLLIPAMLTSRWYNVKTGLAFGFSQICT